MSAIFAAIDLGASSGRVIAGVFSPAKVELHEIARFANGPVQIENSLHWDFDALWTAVKNGLERLGEFAEKRGLPVVSIGVDTWAVDYGLIGVNGELLAAPHHYRDERNLLGADAVHAIIEQPQLYAINGLQFQPFNTVYQLAAEALQSPELLGQASKVLLIPDLIGYLLTGVAKAEVTNASTTGLLDVRTHQWNLDLVGELGIDAALLPDLINPGEVLGSLKPGLLDHPAFATTKVVAIASHDTASAVLAVPKLAPGGAYLSSGTWSLIGAELKAPVLTEASARANFTNELGVDNRVRFLKNLTGLWLLSESIRTWTEFGDDLQIAELIDEAALVVSDSRIDVNDPEFSAPGNMPARISAHCQRRGLTVPHSRAQVTRCILDSLADGYVEAIDELERITETKINQLNIVGGGSQNELLCQLAANKTGLTVVAGPVEATAIGNLALQASAAGLLPKNIEAIRAFVAANFEPKTFTPTSEGK